MRKTSRKLAWIIYCLIIVLSQACSNKHKSTLLNDIYAPKVVGTPPQNAYIGLIRLSNGEIRHYGNGLYIRSLDNGLTWDSINTAHHSYYGYESPVSGDFSD
ncbi:hypothetical protein QQ008_04660 [Fulvivirgaceae bacterium BMA10]|uniref:Exo-alpha-sialidase n=1 Tax=Splendidivirga corallicola TaxID=3051826 RepID=A0ABT8KIT8_9BACT|nr:hypothetical protein [Fulvivirgaceae bacterium BMA10]